VEQVYKQRERLSNSQKRLKILGLVQQNGEDTHVWCERRNAEPVMQMPQCIQGVNTIQDLW